MQSSSQVMCVHLCVLALGLTLFTSLCGGGFAGPLLAKAEGVPGIFREGRK